MMFLVVFLAFLGRGHFIFLDLKIFFRSRCLGIGRVGFWLFDVGFDRFGARIALGFLVSCSPRFHVFLRVLKLLENKRVSKTGCHASMD